MYVADNQVGTVTSMHDSPVESRTRNPIENNVVDLEHFGQLFSLMTNLSRYVDTAAGAVLAGTTTEDAIRSFGQRSVSMYTSLRSDILESISDEQLRRAGELRMLNIDPDCNVVEAAVVIDQAHVWLETTIRHGAFKHRVDLISMQLGVEAAAVSVQLGEQREKALVFENRLNGSDKVPGTYL